MRKLVCCLCVLSLALVAGVSRIASGATLALTSAPGAQLSLYVVGGATVSVDLSTRLRGSLSSEPLGPYQGIRFSLTGDGDPIVASSFVPGSTGLPVTVQIDQFSWTTPDPSQLPSLAPPVGSGAIVPFPTFTAHFSGNVDVGGYVTPFDVSLTDQTQPAGAAPATSLSVFVPTANSIVVGGASSAGPSFKALGSWYPGNHVNVAVIGTLYTQGLLFTPEPSSVVLVTAGLGALTLARRRWARSYSLS